MLSVKNWLEMYQNCYELPQCYLLSLNSQDLHWRPFYEACQPCAVHYDAIATLETISEDAKHILSHIASKFQEHNILY